MDEPLIPPTAPVGAIESATATDQRGPEGTFAEMDGKTFKTPEELSAYVAQKTGDTSHPDYKAPTEEEAPKSDEPKADEGGLKKPEEAKEPEKKVEDGKPSWVQPDITEDALKANLTAAGGFYAEPEYLPLALEFERTGTVSEATLKAYADAKSIPLDMAKTFVEGQAARRDQAANATTQATAQAQAKVDATIKTVYEAVGGEAHYKALAEWSKTGLSDAEAGAYSRALDSDPEAAVVMLKAFNDRFKATGGGQPPRDITNGTGNGGSTPTADAPKGYASLAEQQKDIGSAEYNSDPAFRAKVLARIAATTAF